MRKVLKIVAIALGGLVVLVVGAGAVLGLLGRSRLHATYDAGSLAALPMAQASPQRGEHIARIEGCFACHGERLAGAVFLDIPPGRIVAPNLTAGKGGVGKAYEPADWNRAVRYGVRPSGHWILPFMPYRLYNRLGDDDTADLVAFLESAPAVDNAPGATELRLPLSPGSGFFSAGGGGTPYSSRSFLSRPSRSTRSWYSGMRGICTKTFTRESVATISMVPVGGFFAPFGP